MGEKAGRAPEETTGKAGRTYRWLRPCSTYAKLQRIPFPMRGSCPLYFDIVVDDSAKYYLESSKKGSLGDLGHVALSPENLSQFYSFTSLR